jgi:hypothetical protein
VIHAAVAAAVPPEPPELSQGLQRAEAYAGGEVVVEVHASTLSDSVAAGQSQLLLTEFDLNRSEVSQDTWKAVPSPMVGQP